MEYNVEQKRQWRYWVWRRIAEKCKVHPRFATVLFLAGPSPLDLEAAKKYGFRLENIVAIDVDEDAVRQARASGCTAIQGDLHTVVTRWSDGDIHGIIADYCCGLTLKTAVQSYHMCKIANAVALNFQRGREADAGSRMLREFCKTVNRAEQFEIFCALAWRMLDLDYEFDPEFWAAKSLAFEDIEVDAEYLSRQEFPERWRQDRLKEAIESFSLTELDAELKVSSFENQRMSYRSNKVIMDTIVGAHPLCIRPVKLGVVKKHKVDGRLAACKAIRTMNGAVRLSANSN